MLKRIIKGLAMFLAVFVGVVVLGVGAFVWWASGGDDNPALISAGVITRVADAPNAAPAGTPTHLTALTFNIGYGRGHAGDESGPWTLAHIHAHLDGIAAQIEAAGADIAALQEVDLGAARSHDVDQGRYLLDKLGWPAMSCVVTWQKNHVPFPYWPVSRHYGRMKSGQCVLSRYPINATTRYRLPKPANNAFWRNWFYLDRAIDHVEIALGDRKLSVYNAHLEAFDTDNRKLHAVRLAELLEADPAPLVLALGDFNALPPSVTVTRYPDEPETDYAGDDTVRRVADARGMREVLGAHAEDGPPALTYPAHEPNRRLDYIFHRDGLALEAAEVLSAAPVWSDHLPVVARFTIPR